jgi:hypothetical protein
LLIAACLAATFLLPAGARAQSSSDPEATSPSGTIYEIPLDKARQQAAPQGAPQGSPSGGGGSGSGVASSQDGSTYRSENNFGSSNEVPGASGESRSGASSNPSSRSKSRSRDQLADASAPPKAAADPASSDEPSGGGVVLLLVLLLAVALATVALAIKARRRSS